MPVNRRVFLQRIGDAEPGRLPLLQAQDRRRHGSIDGNSVTRTAVNHNRRVTDGEGDVRPRELRETWRYPGRVGLRPAWEQTAKGGRTTNHRCCPQEASTVKKRKPGSIHVTEP